MSNFEEDTENNLLWHMRLCPMSESGMTKLHGNNLLKDLKACHLNFYRYFVLDKQINVQFQSPTSHTISSALNYVHTDI